MSLDRRKLRGPTQLRAAVVVEDPGEDGVLREVVAAAVGQVVEVEEVLVVAEEAALPLQHVALGRVLRHVILWRERRPGSGERTSALARALQMRTRGFHPD